METPLEAIFALAKQQEVTHKEAARNLSLLTEDSAAEGFTQKYANRLLYCCDIGIWYEWAGVAWVPNRKQRAFHYMRELVRELAKGHTSAKVRSAAGKSSFSAGAERFCRAHPVFATSADQFDADPLLLGTPMGTVDLQTGAIRPAHPADRISKTTTVPPAEVSDCPLWLSFLNDATGDDPALIRFLQQWCGYTLTGLTREHALVFIYGPGGNGKTVFLNALTGILGTYATTAAMDTFTASKSDKHPTDMAMLCGARLVNASETEEGRGWAEARIKVLTGGDPITARFMRQDFFTFSPTFKLTIVGNHQPTLRNVDEAARRRFNIVPFIRKPEKPDRQLEEKLRAEWPAILRWMIEGCLDWQLHGLVRPVIVNEANDSYFSEQDLFGQWLEEKCTVRFGDSNMWDTTQNLHASYSIFMRGAGDIPGSMRMFSSAMRQRGFKAYRTTSVRGFSGVRLRSDQP